MDVIIEIDIYNIKHLVLRNKKLQWMVYNDMNYMKCNLHFVIYYNLMNSDYQIVSSYIFKVLMHMTVINCRSTLIIVCKQYIDIYYSIYVFWTNIKIYKCQVSLYMLILIFKHFIHSTKFNIIRLVLECIYCY